MNGMNEINEIKSMNVRNKVGKFKHHGHEAIGPSQAMLLIQHASEKKEKINDPESIFILEARRTYLQRHRTIETNPELLTIIGILADHKSRGNRHKLQRNKQGKDKNGNYKSRALQIAIELNDIGKTAQTERLRILIQSRISRVRSGKTKECQVGEVDILLKALGMLDPVLHEKEVLEPEIEKIVERRKRLIVMMRLTNITNLSFSESKRLRQEFAQLSKILTDQGRFMNGFKRQKRGQDKTNNQIRRYTANLLDQCEHKINRRLFLNLTRLDLTYCDLRLKLNERHKNAKSVKLLNVNIKRIIDLDKLQKDTGNLSLERIVERKGRVRKTNPSIKLKNIKDKIWSGRNDDEYVESVGSIESRQAEFSDLHMQTEQVIQQPVVQQPVIQQPVVQQPVIQPVIESKYVNPLHSINPHQTRQARQRQREQKQQQQQFENVEELESSDSNQSESEISDLLNSSESESESEQSESDSLESDSLESGQFEEFEEFREFKEFKEFKKTYESIEPEQVQKKPEFEEQKDHFNTYSSQYNMELELFNEIAQRFNPLTPLNPIDLAQGVMLSDPLEIAC